MLKKNFETVVEAQNFCKKLFESSNLVVSRVFIQIPREPNSNRNITVSYSTFTEKDSKIIKANKYIKTEEQK
jgi:hypothetical protein